MVHCWTALCCSASNLMLCKVHRVLDACRLDASPEPVVLQDKIRFWTPAGLQAMNAPSSPGLRGRAEEGGAVPVRTLMLLHTEVSKVSAVPISSPSTSCLPCRPSSYSCY